MAPVRESASLLLIAAQIKQCAADNNDKGDYNTAEKNLAHAFLLSI
jgi:hypothetical protein